MTHDEWIIRQRDLCYQRGLAYSKAGNAKSAAEIERLKALGRTYDVQIEKHAKVKVSCK